MAAGAHGISGSLRLEPPPPPALGKLTGAVTPAPAVVLEGEELVPALVDDGIAAAGAGLAAAGAAAGAAGAAGAGAVVEAPIPHSWDLQVDAAHAGVPPALAVVVA